jgi:hypothetical protein
MSFGREPYLRDGASADVAVERLRRALAASAGYSVSVPGRSPSRPCRRHPEGDRLRRVDREEPLNEANPP